MRRTLCVLLVAAIAGTAAPLSSGAVSQRGSRGGEVAAVQRVLGIPADGIFGRRTERAVRAFQRSRGLPVTGRIDRRTRALLFPRAAGTGGSEAGTAPATSAPAGTPPAPSAATIVDAARSAIGRPYEASAAGPDAFDCSGLVVWAAEQAGISGLPRSSFAQYETGTAVAYADIAPGDLVFFDTAGPGASDVGIASGPNAVISATTHGVREHPLAGPYWGDHFVGARRIG